MGHSIFGVLHRHGGSRIVDPVAPRPTTEGHDKFGRNDVRSSRSHIRCRLPSRHQACIPECDGTGSMAKIYTSELVPQRAGMHLRGQGIPGTSPGNIPTGAKLEATGPRPFFRWSDNPMTRINLALKQGCEAMAPTYDIVTDRKRGCQSDQVAFYHDEFGQQTAYWMCYRCLLVYHTPAPTDVPPPTKPPVPLPESCFSQTVKQRQAVDHGTVMCSTPGPGGQCGKTTSGLPKRLFKGWKCCVC